MPRLILLLGIASALSLVIFGKLLMHWWETNRDNFWIAISIYGFCFVVAVMWFATAKPKEPDDDSEEHW
jgi:hypothetical protein